MPPIYTRYLQPMLVNSMLERGVRFFPNSEIVSKMKDKVTSYSYREFYKRVCRLANVLKKFGIDRGDRVATFAWNTHWHLELYFALPCLGAIVHPLNIRLFKEQLMYICNQAEDKLIFLDEDFIPIIESLQEELKTVKGYVILSEQVELPDKRLSSAFSYEELLSKSSEDCVFPDDLDETEAIMMGYSSGTTGLPRGFFYNHRGPYLGALSIGCAENVGLTGDDVLLQIVPMFHAAGWHFPYAATHFGIKQVYPGSAMDPKSICELIQKEKVTVSNGVPTIWLGVLDCAKRENYDLSSLKTIVVGGAPPPQALIEGMDELGVSVIHWYALSETSCVQVTVTKDWPRTKRWSKEVQFAKRARQGIPGPAGDARVLSEKMEEVQWDSKGIGSIYFRSPGMTSEIYQDPERTAGLFKSGWFDSEDLGTVDEDGYIAIVDRSKDLIKSGGEWISSVDLENIIMAHPAVLEACVVAIPHEKWQERPIAWVVPKENRKDKLTKEEVLKFLEGKVFEGRLARWWLPEEIVFVAEIPKTGTGKFNKKAIRAKYWNKEVK